MNNVSAVCTACKATKSGNGFNLTLKAFTNREIKDAWGITVESFVLTYYMWRSKEVPVVAYDKAIEKELLAEHAIMTKTGEANDKFVTIDLDDYHMELKEWTVPADQPNAGEIRKLKHIVRREIYEASKKREEAKA